MARVTSGAGGVRPASRKTRLRPAAQAALSARKSSPPLGSDIIGEHLGMDLSVVGHHVASSAPRRLVWAALTKPEHLKE